MKGNINAEYSLGSMPMPKAFSHGAAFRHGRPQHKYCDEFWLKHPPMDRTHRAKIFAPFAALRGFEECIAEKEVQYIKRRQLSDDEKEVLGRQIAALLSLIAMCRESGAELPTAEVTFFVSCHPETSLQHGVCKEDDDFGLYETISGTIRYVDPSASKTVTINDRLIALEDICSIST